MTHTVATFSRNPYFINCINVEKQNPLAMITNNKLNPEMK